MKAIMFRDKTTSKDISVVADMGYWDNTVCARDMVSGDLVIITPTKGAYNGDLDAWKNAPAILATASRNNPESLSREGGNWPSGKGGYFHRHYLEQIVVVTVRDILELDEVISNDLLSWQQGGVRYSHFEGKGV